MPRYWGFSTRGKLDLLRRYLDAFTTASKAQPEIVYLDLFGGQPQNRERLTEADLDGSSPIALDDDRCPIQPIAVLRTRAICHPAPRGARDRVCGSRLRGRGRRLQSDHPDHVRRHCRPSTGHRPSPSSTPMAPTCIGRRSKRSRSSRSPRSRSLRSGYCWPQGCSSGRCPLAGMNAMPMPPSSTPCTGRVSGEPSTRPGSLARSIQPTLASEYVNLMRWRLQHVLGYERTHPLEIFNERGHLDLPHDLRHRSPRRRQDHEPICTTPPPMSSRACGRPLGSCGERQAEQEAGIQSLFGDEFEVIVAPRSPRERLYVHAEPWVPYGSADR